MTNTLIQLFTLGLAVGVCAFTVTKSQIFEEFRWFIQDYIDMDFFTGLVTCPYCLSHWLSFAVIAIYQPDRIVVSDFVLFDYFVMSLAVTAIATVAVLVIAAAVNMINRNAIINNVQVVKKADEVVQQRKEANSVANGRN